MPQHANTEVPEIPDDEQDAFRQEVAQIVARRNLMKTRNEAQAPAPLASPASLRKTVPVDVASDDDAPPPAPPAPDWSEKADAKAEFDAFANDTAEEAWPQTLSPFVPEGASPEPDDRRQPLTDRRKGERRKGERRNMEFLRTEIQWSSDPEPADKKRFLIGKSGFRPSRVVLLAVAGISAIIAGWLALSGSPAPTPEPVQAVVEAVEVATTDVLVATEAIGAGQRLTEASIGWHKLPVSAVLPGYISAATQPTALTDLASSVARYPFLPGDPIRADKLVSGAPRTLSATLRPGTRGVSVGVTADAAAGGFIKPDDHVDVVLVTSAEGQRVTRTVLEDVRVLAINAQLGPETTGEVIDTGAALGDVFSGIALATLELDPQAAEVLVQAAASGTLTLTLRPEGTGRSVDSMGRSGANQSIRLTSPFWVDAYSPAIN